MLDQILYVGFDLVGSSLEMSGLPQGQGYYHYNVDVGEFYRDDSRNNESPVFVIDIKASVVGYKEDIDSPEFSANANIDVIFSVKDNAFEITNDIYNNDSWYFDSYIAIAVKQCLDHIFQLSPINGIEIPSYRIQEETN